MPKLKQQKIMSPNEFRQHYMHQHKTVKSLTHILEAYKNHILENQNNE